MDRTIFERNIQAFGSRYPEMLPAVLHAGQDESCIYASKAAKNGCMVPVLPGGMACNSLYDPIREAKQLVAGSLTDGCVLFAGIGGGFHIREYLAANPSGRCLVCEAGHREFRSLLGVVNLVDIISDSRVTIIPDAGNSDLSAIVGSVYLPAIHGNFRVLALRPWQERYAALYAGLGERIRDALATVSADYSVQAHFGRLWFHNALRNLRFLENGNGPIPSFDLAKKAVVAAAGPGLESSLAELRIHRDQYAIFTTDTAYGTLVASGIAPDVFVSIDAQHISVRHAMPGLIPTMTVVVDLCGNPEIPEIARKAGCAVIVAAGGHPLARYASSLCGLPDIETSSGTVTVAALDVAQACGFKKLEILGADFAYVRGKPYARGTYLAEQFDSASNRLVPAETAYDALMFRTEVQKAPASGGGITYKTAVLDRYAAALKNHHSRPSWTPLEFKSYPFRRFIGRYLAELERNRLQPEFTDPALVSLFPFVAWYRSKNGDKGTSDIMAGAIRLASELIAGYTEVS